MNNYFARINLIRADLIGHDHHFGSKGAMNRAPTSAMAQTMIMADVRVSNGLAPRGERGDE